METILTSLGIGLLATTSPCVFPLYPGFLAYISGGQEKLGTVGRYFLGFFVLAGVLTMMLALGAIIAALSISIGSALSVVIPLADLLIISLGILLLLNVNPFKTLPQIKMPVLSHPFANAFVYGLLYGPIALPCSGPLVVSILPSHSPLQSSLIGWGSSCGSGLALACPCWRSRCSQAQPNAGSHASSPGTAASSTSLAVSCWLA